MSCAFRVEDASVHGFNAALALVVALPLLLAGDAPKWLWAAWGIEFGASGCAWLALRDCRRMMGAMRDDGRRGP